MAVTFDLYALVHTNCPILNVVILLCGRVVGRNMEKNSVKEEKDILEVLEGYIPGNDAR